MGWIQCCFEWSYFYVVVSVDEMFFFGFVYFKIGVDDVVYGCYDIFGFEICVGFLVYGGNVVVVVVQCDLVVFDFGVIQFQNVDMVQMVMIVGIDVV